MDTEWLEKIAEQENWYAMATLKNVRELQAELEALREAAQVTHDWMLSDSIFMDFSQIQYHRKVLATALNQSGSE